MTITAATTVILKKAPTFKMVKDNTMAVWSGFGMAGADALGITAFKTLAEELNALHLGEGDAITVTGTITLSTWEGKDGSQHSGLKMIASKADAIIAPTPKHGGR
jgi:single-strand DNA-binding protein